MTAAYLIVLAFAAFTIAFVLVVAVLLIAADWKNNR